VLISENATPRVTGSCDAQAVVRCWTALLASHPPGKPASGGNQSGPLDPWGQQVLRILGSCHRLLSRALDCFEEDAWRGAELPPYDGVLAGVPARLSGAAALPTLLQRLEGWLALLAAMLGTSTAAAVTVPVDLLLGLAQRLLALSGLTRTVPHADHGHVHAARALFPLLHRHALELATAAMARVGPHALPAAGTVAAWATDVVTSTSPVAAPLREAAWQLWARAAALTRVGLDAAESSRAAAVSAAMVRDLAGVSALLGVGLDGGRSELASLAQAGKTDCAASGGALTGAGAVALLDGACHARTQGVAAAWADTARTARDGFTVATTPRQPFITFCGRCRRATAAPAKRAPVGWATVRAATAERPPCQPRRCWRRGRPWSAPCSRLRCRRRRGRTCPARRAMSSGPARFRAAPSWRRSCAACCPWRPCAASEWRRRR